MDVWGAWFRSLWDKHHDEYVLLMIAFTGAMMTLHVLHHSGDRELIAFGREMTVGALTCLYGFLRGKKTEPGDTTSLALKVTTPPLPSANGG